MTFRMTYIDYNLENLMKPYSSTHLKKNLIILTFRDLIREKRLAALQHKLIYVK